MTNDAGAQGGSGPEFSPDEFQRIVQGLSTAIAIATGDFAIRFENARFFQWFPPVDDGEDRLPSRFKFDAALVAGRLAEGRSFSLEVETTRAARPVPVGLEFRALGDSGLILIEGRDLSGQKRAEYMLETYSQISEKHTRELQREKDRVEKLLLNIMPRSVYQEMKDYGMVTPQRFDHASVLMLDFVGFTDMAISREPSTLIAELNDIFTGFDRIVELFGCERIKTIGDAYLAVSGVPESNPDHAQNVARAALRMRRYIQRRNASHSEQWQCRIGIATGALVGSIVGIQKYLYDVFGPAVNLCARMESVADPMQIVFCGDMYGLLCNDFVCVERGEMQIKGFGSRMIHSLEREDSSARS